MLEKSMLSEEKFWNIVDGILNLNTTTQLDGILESFQINRFEFNCFYTFFKDLGVDINLELIDEKTFVSLDSPKNIEIDMTLGQWLKFQAHFPVMENLKLEPYNNELMQVLKNTDEKYQEANLFNSINNFEAILKNSKKLSLVDSLEKKHIGLIEEAIVTSKSIDAYFDTSLVSILPIKLLSISKELHLVFEISGKQILDVIKIDKITSLTLTSRDSDYAFTPTEVESFIKNLRELDSKEERLVLKVKDFNNFNREIKNEFFRNEVLVQNYSGDHIWAASIEPNDNLFEWLFSQGRSVEIISTESLKKEYLNFCQRKLKKLA